MFVIPRDADDKGTQSVQKLVSHFVIVINKTRAFESNTVVIQTQARVRDTPLASIGYLRLSQRAVEQAKVPMVVEQEVGDQPGRYCVWLATSEA